MTVNFIEITRDGTAHATDSLITKRTATGRDPSELSGKPKFVHIPKFHGIMSWFGTVQYGGWNALEFLTKKAEEAEKFTVKQIQDFSDNIAHDIGIALNGGGWSMPEKGCGIHFTFYEELDEYWVPELMFITNYSGYEATTGYQTGGPALLALRQTFHTISGNKDVNYSQHGDSECRRAVHSFINNVRSLWYTNGDNFFTNAGFEIAENSQQIFLTRKMLKTHNALKLAQWRTLFAVKTAVEAHKIFSYEPLVGGKCFSTAVMPPGDYNLLLEH